MRNILVTSVNLSHGRAGVGRPAISYLQQLFTDTVRCLEDLPEAINDRDEWRERERERERQTDRQTESGKSVVAE